MEIPELRVTPDRFLTYRYAGASGDFNPIHIDDEYARGDRHAIALNLTSEPRPLPVAGEVALSTHLDGAGTALRANEGVVLRI